MTSEEIIAHAKKVLELAGDLKSNERAGVISQVLATCGAPTKD